jgi:amino acid transporter
VLHISDEVKKARLQLPRSMITSVVLNAFMQFIFMITVLFTIGDVNVVSSDPLPIIQVYYQATASRPATNLFVSMLGIIFTFSFFNIFASVSRLLWAFSRDNGLPFSTTFAQVHPTLKLPLNSLILLGACLCLLALINIGSSTGIGAVHILLFPNLFSFLETIVKLTSCTYSVGTFQTRCCRTFCQPWCYVLHRICGYMDAVSSLSARGFGKHELLRSHRGSRYPGCSLGLGNFRKDSVSGAGC